MSRFKPLEIQAGVGIQGVERTPNVVTYTGHDDVPPSLLFRVPPVELSLHVDVKSNKHVNNSHTPGTGVHLLKRLSDLQGVSSLQPTLRKARSKRQRPSLHPIHAT